MTEVRRISDALKVRAVHQRDEIAHEDKAIAGREAHLVQQASELARAAVHVADDDGARHPSDSKDDASMDI